MYNMKFLLLFVFVFFLAFQSRGEWEFISEDKNKSTIYMDVQSIKIFKNLIYA